MKNEKAEARVEDIRFISLPNVEQLRRAGASEKDLRAYYNRSFRLQLAQRAMAVQAVSIMMPEMFNESKRQRDIEVRRLNEEHATRMLDVFSETCTRGLD